MYKKDLALNIRHKTPPTNQNKGINSYVVSRNIQVLFDCKWNCATDVFEPS